MTGHVPFVRIFIPFAGGILTAIFAPVPSWLPKFLFLLGFLNAGIRLLSGKNFPRTFEWIAGTGFSLCLFAAGMLRLFLADDFRFAGHYSTFQSSIAVSGILNDELHHKTKSFKTTLKVDALCDSSGKWHPAQGQMLLYTSKTPQTALLKYGDRIIVYARPAQIPPPQNPEEFNYKRYLAFHQIYAQLYAPEHRILKTGSHEGNPLVAFALDLRKNLMAVFERFIQSKREVAVASALILGFRDNLDIEQINAFASAGALHVLAVSGMHVGILFLVFGTLLNWMDKFRKWRWIRPILLLMVVWFYALLTGLSPSVLRASVMISVVLLGQLLGKKGNVYNSMLIAATVLLLYQPYMITEVGFQLSFLAVFGIIALHPVIFRWWEPSGLLLHKIWEITSVSIAAQIMTFPVGLLYFHQFPVLFFISNLVVIPLAFVIMISGLILLLISTVPAIQFLASLFGKVVYFIIWLLNQSVLLVDRQATSVIREISISITETWIIYIIILFVFLFITTAVQKHFIAALACLACLLVFQVYESWLQANKKMFAVYSVRNHDACTFIQSRRLVFMADDSLKNNHSSMLFHVLHHWWAEGILNSFHPDSSGRNGAIMRCSRHAAVFNGKKFLFLSGFPKISSEELTPLKTDYLILSEGSFIHAASLNRLVHADRIILNSSIPKWKAARLSEKLNGNIYSVSSSGAYVETFD